MPPRRHKMIRSGDTIHNPVTGERITFHQTSADPNGVAVGIECPIHPSVVAAARRPRAGRARRAPARLRGLVRAAGGHACTAGGLTMKRRFYFILFVLVLVVLAVPGFAAKAAKRVARPALRLA